MNARTLSLALSLAALLAGPGSAAAHIRVTGSTPAAGSVSTAAVREVRITFSQRVAERFTRITVVDANGVELPVSSLAPTDSTSREFSATLAEPLPSGTYTVRWRTAGADGHVVNGEFAFSVSAEVLDTVKPPTLPDPGTPPVPLQTARDANVSPNAVVGRWVNFLALFLALGVVGFRALVLPSVRFEAAPESYWASLEGSLRKAGILTALLVLLAAVPRLLRQTTALLGREAILDPAAVQSVVIGTAWGTGWLLQVLAGILLLLAAAARQRTLALIGAAVLALTPALSGHAMAVEGGTTLAVIADTLHVGAVGAWLGSLAVLVMLALPLAVRSGAYGGLAASVRAFSPVALISAAVLLLTGAASAFLHLHQVSQLWTTNYGRALLVKLAAVVALAVVARHNWKRVKPTLGAEEPTWVLRRTAGVELALAGVVLLVTAVLIALPSPP